MSEFADTLAIVAGGSRGLGAEVARALHERGARPVVLSRQGSQEPTPWEQAHVDLSDEEAVERFFSEYATSFGDRNLLVNFAGVRYNVPLAESDPSTWRACVDSSLLTTYLMTRGFARASQGHRSGAIVNMASIHAATGAAGRSAYAAAKAAVVQFTAVAAVELAPAIRVNCVAPGFIGTAASRQMIATGNLDGSAIERRTPLGRLGEEADIAQTVLFLLSEASGFITGETIRVDGGWLRHAEV